MALTISSLIAAPDSEHVLFSPTEPFNYALYSLPPSPPLSDQPSPLRTPDPEPVCLPTHQVFDLPDITRPSTPSSAAPQTITPSITETDSVIVATGTKRSASPAPPVAKKRAVGDRVSTKDYVPPDVTGLSKREARLVKNRAAAFLSRQRKREEFETMEIRVAELEQENKRLLALAQLNLGKLQTSPTDSSDGPTSEVEFLKAQLAAAQERAQSLSAQLEQRKETNFSPIVKVESLEPDTVSTAPVSSPPRSTGLPAHKSSASLGLMVLLCALPSLFSMRMQSPASAASVDNGFAISNAFHSSGARSSFDFDFDNSMFVPNEFDWSYSKSSSFIDLDEPTSKINFGTKKLEFKGVDSLESLGDLDISFDTSASNDGKIRVRIHPHSSSTSSASSISSRSVSRGTTPEGEDSSMSVSASLVSSPRPRSSALGLDLSSTRDPFLGVTSLSDTDDIDVMMTSYSKDENPNFYTSTFDQGSSFLSSLTSSLTSLGGDYGMLDGLNTCGMAQGKRRVRIALKSAPQAASEGGEWEVQIC